MFVLFVVMPELAKPVSVELIIPTGIRYFMVEHATYIFIGTFFSIVEIVTKLNII